MTDLIPNPDGPDWIEDPATLPTYCPLGHSFTPGSYRRVHNLGTDFWHCELDGHEDPRTRWCTKRGAQVPAPAPMNTPDHGWTG